jgi:hypothetical protein
MRRLQDEILGRYVEMAAIMERVLDMNGLRERATQPGGRIAMNFKEGSSYICIEVDGGGWEDPPGWCREGGC